MPVGYDTPRKLVAMAGVGCAIYGFLNISVTFILLGAAVLGWFAFCEQ
ncbi:MAG: hypothetical protein R6V05_13950 [Candidatus Brocadiia bacterium]